MRLVQNQAFKVCWDPVLLKNAIFFRKKKKCTWKMYMACLFYHLCSFKKTYKKHQIKKIVIAEESINKKPGFFAKIYLKRALTFKRTEICKRNLLHTWFSLLLIIRGTRFNTYFSFKFCKRLCVSVLQLFPTLVIKMLISFQRNMYMKTARTFFFLNKGVSFPQQKF